MRIIILLFSLFLFQSQKIVVLNDATTEPISSANIYIYKDGKSIKSGSTNEKGEYYFNNKYDSIIVHSIGYEEEKWVKNGNLDITIFLKAKTTVLKEVIVSVKKNNVILGDYKKESSETRIIGKDEQFSVYFKKPVIKNYKIESIFLNLKRIPYKADLVFNFYSVDSIKRVYTNQSRNTKTTLTEVIPNTKNNLGSIQYKLSASLGKEILEVDLDSLDLRFPEEGIFVSVYVKNIYENKGSLKLITSVDQLPIIYKRKTKDNNYCEKLPYIQNYWRNVNLVMRHHEETDKFRTLFPMSYYEPSLGLKIEETNN